VSEASCTGDYLSATEQTRVQASAVCRTNERTHTILMRRSNPSTSQNRDARTNAMQVGLAWSPLYPTRCPSLAAGTAVAPTWTKTRTTAGRRDEELSQQKTRRPPNFKREQAKQFRAYSQRRSIVLGSDTVFGGVRARNLQTTKADTEISAWTSKQALRSSVKRTSASISGSGCFGSSLRPSIAANATSQSTLDSELAAGSKPTEASERAGDHTR
jgi:hypothetical protein